NIALNCICAMNLRDATLPIGVVSLSGLNRQVFLLHRQQDVVITGGGAVFIGCITHAVLGAQFLDNAGVDLADGFFLRDFEETSTRFFGNPLENFLAIRARFLRMTLPAAGTAS